MSSDFLADLGVGNFMKAFAVLYSHFLAQMRLTECHHQRFGLDWRSTTKLKDLELYLGRTKPIWISLHGTSNNLQMHLASMLVLWLRDSDELSTQEFTLFCFIMLKFCLIFQRLFSQAST